MLPPFALEVYMARYEFAARYTLCSSDAESFSMQEVLDGENEETRRLWEGLRLGYTEVRGLPVLREEIASLYPPLAAHHIITFAGAEEGILCASLSLLDHDAHVIVVTPCYQSLRTLPEYAGATITSIELRENDHWQLDPARIAQAITPRTQLLIINFPHNPPGR